MQKLKINLSLRIHSLKNVYFNLKDVIVANSTSRNHYNIIIKLMFMIEVKQVWINKV